MALHKSAVTNATVPVEERPSVIERAFQIAKSATVSDVAQLSGQLAAEGYGNAEQVLSGRSLALQLTRMIAEAGPPTVL